MNSALLRVFTFQRFASGVQKPVYLNFSVEWEISMEIIIIFLKLILMLCDFGFELTEKVNT